MSSIRLAAVIAAGAATMALAAGAVSAPPPPGPFVPGELVVRFRPEAAASRGGTSPLARARGLNVARTALLPDTVVVDGGKDAASLLARLQQDPEVAWARRHRYVEFTGTVPNDPFFPSQYQWLNLGQSGVAGADIRATEAWDLTTGSVSTVLAIVDTGLDITHFDFAGRLWTNPGEIAGNGVDDDSNGFIDDMHGWNSFYNTNEISDSGSHGTFVAGMAAATGNNGGGVAGADWNARLMIVNCFPPGAPSTETAVADGILYAARNGARVINLSLGTPDFSPLMNEAVREALARGVLVCAAAGNDGLDTDAHPFYPAGSPYDGVLAVGGSTSSDTWIHNYGRTSVHLAAPSLNVFSTRPFNSHGYGSGTSYAAPQATGVGGLLAARHPGLSAAGMKFRMAGTARQATAFLERNGSKGVLDAAAALQSLDTIAPGPVDDLYIDQTGWNGAVLRFTAPGDDGQNGTPAFYQLRVTTAPLDLTDWELTPLTPVHVRPAVAGSTEFVLLNHLEPGSTYWCVMRALDEAGNAGSFSTAAQVTLPEIPPTTFFDPCSTITGSWSASGFSLAPGDAHTGSLSWQDSPGEAYTTATTAFLESTSLTLSGLPRPRLSFHLKWLFPRSGDRSDGMRVEVTSDGSTWHRLRTYALVHSPMRRESIPLDDFTSASSIRIRFLFQSGSDSRVDDGVYLDDIRLHDLGAAVAENREVIIEPYDYLGNPARAEEVVVAGAWSAETTGRRSRAPRLEGRACLRSSAGTTGTTVQAAPLLTSAGRYEVFVTWSSLYSATGTVYRVRDLHGLHQVAVDQSLSASDRWVSLGTYSFGYGRSMEKGSVELSAADAHEGTVQADGVLFRYLGLESQPPQPVPAGAGDWPLYD